MTRVMIAALTSMFVSLCCLNSSGLAQDNDPAMEKDIKRAKLLQQERELQRLEEDLSQQRLALIREQQNVLNELALPRHPEAGQQPATFGLNHPEAFRHPAAIAPAEPARPVNVFGMRSDQGLTGQAMFPGILERKSDAQIRELVAKIKKSKSDDEKEELKNEIQQVLEEQYDAHLKRLEAPLEQLEAKLEKLKNEYNKRKDAKADLVQHRLNSIWYGANGMGWPESNNTTRWGYAPRAMTIEGRSFSQGNLFIEPSDDRRLPIFRGEEPEMIEDGFEEPGDRE